MGEPHFYGGQAVIEGVMMRGVDEYATAVRRRDGSVVVDQRPVPHFLQGSRWARLPFVRGTFMLVETLTLGLRSLQFSANVALEDEAQTEPEPTQPAQPAGTPWGLVAVVAAAVIAAVYAGTRFLTPVVVRWLPEDPASWDPKVVRIGLGFVLALIAGAISLWALQPRPQAPPPQTVSDRALWLAMMPALALGVGLFILLPSFLAGLVKLGEGYGAALAKNVVEGAIRLGLILGYVGLISLMPQVRRVFQYHGAEHKTINALEIDGGADPVSAAKHSPLHPRCGTAFLLLFIVLKIIVGWFFGWPVWYWRLGLRLLMVPVVAALAYETTRLAGRHRNSVLARLMSGPGLLLQRMTTREPERGMVDVAIYALAAVASEVPLPAGWPPAAAYGAVQPAAHDSGKEEPV